MTPHGPAAPPAQLGLRTSPRLLKPRLMRCSVSVLTKWLRKRSEPKIPARRLSAGGEIMQVVETVVVTRPAELEVRPYGNSFPALETRWNSEPELGFAGGKAADLLGDRPHSRRISFHLFRCHSTWSGLSLAIG